jgi:hypothetical protein
MISTMVRFEPTQAGLDTLLDLNGYTIEVGGGFWVSITTSSVPGDTGRPHGIQYALSLHAPGGKRVLGYDNAHAPQMRRGPSNRSAKPATFDHVHRGERIVLYEFLSPGDLLVDFWRDVEAILKRGRSMT